MTHMLLEAQCHIHHHSRLARQHVFAEYLHTWKYVTSDLQAWIHYSFILSNRSFGSGKPHQQLIWAAVHVQGSGGFGAVFCATWRGREVAVKVRCCVQSPGNGLMTREVTVSIGASCLHALALSPQARTSDKHSVSKMNGRLGTPVLPPSPP